MIGGMIGAPSVSFEYVQKVCAGLVAITAHRFRICGLFVAAWRRTLRFARWWVIKECTMGRSLLSFRVR